MALTVVNQTTTFGGAADFEVFVTPTPGNWLLAAVAWHSFDGMNPIVSVGDHCRNIWTLLYSTTTQAFAAHPSAQLWLQIWACPNVTYDGWPNLGVYLASMAGGADDSLTPVISIIEVAGFTGALTVDSVTLATATSATSLSVTAPAPSAAANCLMLGAAAVDNSTPALSVTSAGWTALTPVLGHGPDTDLAPAWRTSTTGQTASWSTTAAANWVGVVAAIRETGAAVTQPNPNWPAVQYQLGFGYDVSTPLSAVAWTDITPRVVEFDTQRGIPYDLGVAQSAESNMKIRNKDGAFTPRAAATASATAAGTTTTIKVADASATGIYVSDYFNVKSSGGALKELTAFQVVSTAAVGGTTTITFTPAAKVATATGDVYAGVPVDVNLPYRVLATWNGKTYPVATGYVERWPQTWEMRNYGYTTPVAVDTLATLTAANPTAVRGEILRRSPHSYWPLNDASGAGLATNIGVTGNAQLVQSSSIYGVGADQSADFGVSTQGIQKTFPGKASIFGDSGSGWQQTGLTSAELVQHGYALVSPATSFPSISGGVTILGVFLQSSADNTIVVTATIDPTIMIIRNTDPGAGISQGSVLKITQHAASRPGIVVWDKGTHAATTTNLGSGVNVLSAEDFRVWAITFNQTSWTYVDGAGDTQSGTCNLTDTFTEISIGGEADRFWNGRITPGIYAHIAVFPRRLTTGEIRAIGDTVTYGGLRSETTNRRIQRKLDTVNWRGARVLNASGITMGAEAEGGTVTDVGNAVAADEDSLLFVDSAGQMQYRARGRAYVQSVRYVLGDRDDLGEIPYLDDVTYDYDSTFIYNEVDTSYPPLNTAPGSTITSTATDPVSAKRYSVRSLARATRLATAGDTYNLAWWLLSRYSYPQLRVEQVVVDAASNPNAWPMVLGVEVGDLVTLNRRPLNAPMISSSCRVMQIQHATEPGKWQTTLTLAPAPPTALITNDPVHGIVGTNTGGA
jgi:hypothetical protein